MPYIKESSAWRARRRHRQQITLAVVLLLLVGAGGIGYGVWSGALGTKNPPGAATLPPCPAVPARKALTPDRVTVNVYNATRRAGLAGSAARALKDRSFVVGDIRNDPLNARVTGTAVVRYGAKAKAAAALVAAQVTGAQLVPVKRTSTEVDLVLGVRYAGLAPVKATPIPTPSACQSATPSTRPPSS